ncbi:hypothetical protein Tsubulata_000036 [Turnera subulata]|uniref:Uncharacterized protein n=1 Tax=Turnera subulata TaxID=218843 RepID=A0A9Q0FJ86_9ROSI|nr:hypothetical protein Tsubulata_000036 [Turnera subulata]
MVRVPSLHPHNRSGELSSNNSRVRKSDKWFNLILGDRPAALDNLNFWHPNVRDPMMIDIVLVHRGPTSSSPDNLYNSSDVGTSVETVIERWAIQFETLKAMVPQAGESSVSYKKTYKKSIILLRSLYSQMRLLPAYRVFRQLSSSSQAYDFDIIYKVSSFCEPFSRAEEEKMREYNFVPVEAHPGRLCISVTYRSTLSDINLESMINLPPTIITDYVGSPNTDPLRSFPSTGKRAHPTSFPLRGIRPGVSAPFGRPHSWTSGFHRPAPSMLNQVLTGSPPAYRASSNPYDSTSPPPDTYGHRVQSYKPPNYQRASYDEHQLSPPYSPSMSPSTPSYLSNGNPVQARIASETAPVSIPLPMTGRTSRYLSPNFSDSSKSSLPPMSPKSARHDPSSQESPSGIRLIKRSESLRVGELHSGHKIVEMIQEGSQDCYLLVAHHGLSFQDDLDECDFSCPFDVDDVDTPGSHPRTAAPLRQDPSCYSSNSLRTDLEDGVATASGFFMPRKTADALEELRSYREMKDLLLSKSGNRVPSCPVCHLTFPPSELERHANSHFDDDDGNVNDADRQLAIDFELAQRIALDLPLPESTPYCKDDDANNESEQTIEGKISCLISLQAKAATSYNVESNGGLMALLRRRLEQDRDNAATVLLCGGHVDHYQSTPSEDAGWGCGWRNIQMLASHLLSRRRDDAGEVLFGGAGFVPDIPSLQRWLELAWEKGFDAPGSLHFNHSVYGSNHKIGTTECAALFRSFGLRARIVDFGPKEMEKLFLTVPGNSVGSEILVDAKGKRKAFQVCGPMDRFVVRLDSDDVGKSESGANDESGSSTGLTVENKEKKKSHQVLLDWVWNYFSEDSSAKFATHQRVIVTDKTPLYFQHDGHSRTIVGIEVRHQKNGILQYNLLIFDPGHRTEALERSLRENVGWKKRIKRGVHTLKKPQYQLCYIDPGIAIREEMEQLKTIDSVFVEF